MLTAGASTARFAPSIMTPPYESPVLQWLDSGFLALSRERVRKAGESVFFLLCNRKRHCLLHAGNYISVSSDYHLIIFKIALTPLRPASLDFDPPPREGYKGWGSIRLKAETWRSIPSDGPAGRLCTEDTGEITPPAAGASTARFAPSIMTPTVRMGFFSPSAACHTFELWRWE